MVAHFIRLWRVTENRIGLRRLVAADCEQITGNTETKSARAKFLLCLPSGSCRLLARIRAGSRKLTNRLILLAIKNKATRRWLFCYLTYAQNWGCLRLSAELCPHSFCSFASGMSAEFLLLSTSMLRSLQVSVFSGLVVHRTLCTSQLDSGVTNTGKKPAGPVAISRSRSINR